MREEEQEQEHDFLWEGKRECYRGLSSTNKLNLHEIAIINDLSDIAVLGTDTLSQKTPILSPKSTNILMVFPHDFLPFFFKQENKKVFAQRKKSIIIIIIYAQQ